MFHHNAPAADASEYELNRLKNIEENESLIGVIKKDIEHCKDKIVKSIDNSERKKKRSPNQKMNNATQNFVRRSARFIKDRKPTNYNENNSDNDSDNNDGPSNKKSRQGSVKVKFDFFTKKKSDKAFYSVLNDDDFIDDDDDEIELEQSQRPKRARRINASKIPRLPVSKVTKTILANITYLSSRKTYGENGTTCHQCRQKTLDTKSYCRHKWCQGSRGMFCGFCLKKRYGEDVAVVLLNPKWACPPCRGYCNCSICRRRAGKQPTGILAHIAEAQGYNCVKDLLNVNEGGSSASSDFFESVDKSLTDTYPGQSSDDDE